MTPNARYGFRCDSKHGERRLTDAAAAFHAHCAADPKAEPDRECYLSAFQYPDEFKSHLHTTASTADYKGRCGSPWLWFDLDYDDPNVALTATKGLVGYTLRAFTEFDEDDLLVFYSGAKGYHVGVPLTHGPPPSDVFNAVCREVAESAAAEREVRIDSGIYDKVRLLRAPNSKHPKTGLHKVRLTHDELMGLTHERIAALARAPIPFGMPTVRAIPPALVERWQAAEAVVAAKRTAKPPRAATAVGRLNRPTMDYIRHGADTGERHPRLFSAAANLREFGAPKPLITALLEEVALDDGLSPSEVSRQIKCGIDHADRQAEGGAV